MSESTITRFEKESTVISARCNQWQSLTSFDVAPKDILDLMKEFSDEETQSYLLIAWVSPSCDLEDTENKPNVRYILLLEEYPNIAFYYDHYEEESK